MANVALSRLDEPTTDRPPTGSLRGINAEMLGLASVQHGVVSRKQLLSYGFTVASIDRMVNQLRLVPVFQGVYGVGRGIINEKGRWWAGLLAAGDGSVLARRSAAALWGFGPSVRMIEVVRSFNRRPGNAPRETNVDDLPKRLIVHRTRRLPAIDTKTVQGFPVTSVARALLDLSAVSSDKQVATYLGEASRLGILDLYAIEEVCSRGPGWRGSRRLRTEVEKLPPAIGLSKSELEGLFLRICRDYAIPAPEVNVKVEGLEVDCFWRDARFAVELDSYTFHQGRAAFEKDRTRDLHLAGHDYRVMRFSDRMLKNKREQVAKSVLEILKQRGR